MIDFKIGILGGGVLGQAIKNYYPDAKVFDKYQEQDLLEEVQEQDYFFICVPTPYKEGTGIDLEEVADAISRVAQPGKIVIIKSTVIPGTTDYFQEKYPETKILFCPEFLTEATSLEDFASPDKQIVGYTEKSRDIAEQILKILPQGKYNKIVSAKAAELIKLAINNYYALKVVYANQLYDLCQGLGIDYDQVKEGVASDKRIIDSHLQIFHKGYRGFGGKCLPKDLDNLIKLASDKRVDLELFKVVKKINDKLISNNK